MLTRYAAGLLLALFSLSATAQQTLPLPQGNPPENPDKCYAVCYIPQEFETTTESIQTYDAGQQLLVATPTYETYREQVMVKPASYRLKTVPTEYSTVEERVLVRPAYTELVVEPARFETVTERVLVEEASSSYRVGQPTFETVTNSNLYYGSPSDVPGQLVSSDYGNVLDPAGRRGLDNGTDPFNPDNPASFLTDPDSPLNAAPRTYASDTDVARLFDSGNADSPFSAAYINANGIEAAQREATRLLQRAQVGTIAPYITTEARVEIDRIPRTFRTETERIEVTPAYYTYEQVPTQCESGDCLSFCVVEVPAQYQTINRRIAEACAAGYTPAGIEQGGEDYCVRLSYTPAEYGPRQVLVGGPAISQEDGEAKYRNVDVQRLVSPARTVERQVEAEYRTITKRVVSRAAYTTYELVPAEFKTVTRRVRTGLAGTAYTFVGGVLAPNGAAPSTYGNDRTGTERVPVVVNPAAGAKLPGSVLPYTLGSGPDRAGNISADGYAPVSPNVGSGPAGLPELYYTAGCPSGYRFDPLDGLCKSTGNRAAETQSVTRRSLTSRGNFSEWTEVLCPQKATTASIRDVQRALNRAGYDVGTADGVMGARTKAALAKYQRDNNLPIGGMNMPTLRRLGL